MKVVLAFFTSLGISFGSLFGYLTISTPKEPEVLPTQVQSESMSESPGPSLSVSAIPMENASPSPLPSLSPISTKTPFQKPKSLSPTPTKTPSPSTDSSPSPTPKSTLSAPASYEPFFVQYSSQYGVNKGSMIKIADCESNFDPNVVNGDYLGMFQFASQTWISKRTLMGLDTNASLRTNAEESIKTAAFTISVNGISPWANCV